MVGWSLYLPVYLEGPLSYGGLGAELGGGWKMSSGNVTPYVGTGLSGRLQFSEGDSVLGAAPYAQLGVSAAGIGDGRAFLELRAYQNVFPVITNMLVPSLATPLCPQIPPPMASVAQAMTLEGLLIGMPMTRPL